MDLPPPLLREVFHAAVKMRESSILDSLTAMKTSGPTFLLGLTTRGSEWTREIYSLGVDTTQLNLVTFYWLCPPKPDFRSIFGQDLGKAVIRNTVA